MCWSALLLKIKTRWQSLRNPTNIYYPTFWGLWGAFSRQVCPVTDVGELLWVASGSISCSRLAWSTSRCHRDTLNSIIFRVTTCERGAVKASDDIWCTSHARSGPVPGWPPWWSSVFFTTFVWFFLEKEGSLGPLVWSKQSSFQLYNSFTLHDSWTARSS